MPARSAAARMAWRNASLRTSGLPMRVPERTPFTRSPKSSIALSGSRWRDIHTRPSASLHCRCSASAHLAVST